MNKRYDCYVVVYRKDLPFLKKSNKDRGTLVKEEYIGCVWKQEVAEKYLDQIESLISFVDEEVER